MKISRRQLKRIIAEEIHRESRWNRSTWGPVDKRLSQGATIVRPEIGEEEETGSVEEIEMGPEPAEQLADRLGVSHHDLGYALESMGLRVVEAGGDIVAPMSDDERVDYTMSTWRPGERRTTVPVTTDS